MLSSHSNVVARHIAGPAGLCEYRWANHFNQQAGIYVWKVGPAPGWLAAVRDTPLLAATLALMARPILPVAI